MLFLITKEVYNRGFLAGRANAPENACPYVCFGKLIWLLGFQKGQDEFYAKLKQDLIKTKLNNRKKNKNG